MGSKKSKSSRLWLERQHSDYYVLLAREEGYRSRAAYKLLEIQQKDKILSKGMTVVDLGAAPGGWSQVAARIVGDQGQIWAIDLLPMEPLTGVNLIQGDFEAEASQAWAASLEGKVGLVLSDMAPNMSGIPSVDQARASALGEMALQFAQQVLVKNGNFLIKVFQGTGFQEYIKALRACFKDVVVRKPKASRAGSREVYLLAKGYLSPKDIRGAHLERYA